MREKMVHSSRLPSKKCVSGHQRRLEVESLFVVGRMCSVQPDAHGYAIDAAETRDVVVVALRDEG